MFKEWLKKLKKEVGEKKEEELYPNRFVKFYYLNKNRLNKERRSGYHGRRKSGVCVRCRRKSVPGIVFCEYHQQKQKEYNLKARSKPLPKYLTFP